MSLSKEMFELPVEFHRVDGILLTSHFPVETLEQVKQFQPHSTDVLSATYSKSGQTWLLTIMHLVNNAEKLEKGEEPELNMDDWNYAELKMGNESGVDKLMKKPSPRMIKTHLPLRYWQKQLDKDPEIKVVQVVRNPKDVLVSFYHFFRMNKGLGLYLGTWDDFFELIKTDNVVYGDLFKQVPEWYSYNKSRENSLVVVYEDMKVNLKDNVIKIAKFLGKDLSETAVDLIVEKTTFKNMKKDSKLNYADAQAFDQKRAAFLRKGVVGDWKNYFNDEQSKYIDQKMKDHFDNIGLTFDS